MKRSIPAFIVAAFAVIPVVAHAATVKSAAAAKAAKTTVKKYKGPTVDMRWGPVQVTVYIKGKKITDVKASVSPDTSRSQFIDDQSIPMLHDEVLQAQSGTIDIVSGATYTSEAFIQSLKAALKKAHYKAPTPSS
jgi:uncharacterized protein with FMN-binding domain